MSATPEAGVRLSESDFLDWLKVKPRTLGWSAWLAYDRETANAALRQDHTARWDTHPLTVPVSGVVSLADTLREHLYDVRFEAPQISFESSMVSSARVRFSTYALSGTQLTVEVRTGLPKRVSKVESFTPLQGPRLYGSAFIDDAEGLANAARQVRFDLGTGEGYRFALSHLREAQTVGGTFFNVHYGDLPAPSRYCLLNTLGKWDDGTLVPGVVRARPFPADDAATSGDGAVVLMIAAEGGDVGQLPDNEGGWPYPVPDGYATTLLVSNQAMMTGVLEPGLRSIGEGAEFEYKNEDAGGTVVTTLRALKGTLPLTVQAQVAPFASVNYALEPALASDPAGRGGFAVTADGSGLKVSWQASSLTDAQAPLLHTEGPAGQTSLDYALRARLVCRYTVDADGRVGLEAVDEANSTWFKPVYRQAGVLDALHYQHFPALSTKLTEVVVAALRQKLAGIGGGDINPLLDVGVTFPGDTAVRAGSAHVPMDLAVFGTTAARSGAFTLQAPTRYVVAGDELPIAAVPAQPGAVWSVELLDGVEGTPGTVSSEGIYRAPTPDELTGDFTLVKVSATHGGHTQSVLVSVMRAGMALNPRVFATRLGSARTRLAAGCADGGPLEWSISSATGARLDETTSDEDTLLEPGERLYVAGKTPSGGNYSVDTITVSNPRTGESKTSYAFVAEKDEVGVVLIKEDATLPPDKIQLVLDGGLGPVPETQWTVCAGAGSISAEGIYTLDPTSESPFAVITGEKHVENVVSLFDYLILPLPLVNLDELRRALK